MNTPDPNPLHEELVKRLNGGCIWQPGEDYGHEVDYTATDALMSEAAQRISALEAVLDEGVLAEAFDRAWMDLGRKREFPGISNIIGRHMAHHVHDVAVEQARTAITKEKPHG